MGKSSSQVNRIMLLAVTVNLWVIATMLDPGKPRLLVCVTAIVFSFAVWSGPSKKTSRKTAARKAPARRPVRKTSRR